MGLFRMVFKAKDKKAIMGGDLLRQGDKAIMFRIEPMVGAADLVYLPDEETWKNYAPSLVKNS